MKSVHITYKKSREVGCILLFELHGMWSLKLWLDGMMVKVPLYSLPGILSKRGEKFKGNKN